MTYLIVVSACAATVPAVDVLGCGVNWLINRADNKANRTRAHP